RQHRAPIARARGRPPRGRCRLAGAGVGTRARASLPARGARQTARGLAPGKRCRRHRAAPPQWLISASNHWPKMPCCCASATASTLRRTRACMRRRARCATRICRASPTSRRRTRPCCCASIRWRGQKTRACALNKPSPPNGFWFGGEGWVRGQTSCKRQTLEIPEPPAPSPYPLPHRQRWGREIVVVPVCYGGEYGPDIDAVAEHAGLSRDDVIARHTAAEYTVAMLGFAPGFPY